MRCPQCKHNEVEQRTECYLCVSCGTSFIPKSRGLIAEQMRRKREEMQRNIRVGCYARYRGEWVRVIHVDGDEVHLRGWRGLDGYVVKRAHIDAIREG